MENYRSILPCTCWQCRAGKHSKVDCIKQRCNCCDLEDMFAMIESDDLKEEVTYYIAAEDPIKKY